MPSYSLWFTKFSFRAHARTRRHSPRLYLERLEERNVPSNYIVNTVNDLLNDPTPGEVTLRDVFTAINAQAPSGNAVAGTAANAIQFAIGATGSVQTINVGSGNIAGPLPALIHQATINGLSQGGVGYSGAPLIVLNGASAGGNADGLQLQAGSSSSHVSGLNIRQFSGNGIEIEGSNNNLITANYIGTDVAGSSAAGNGNDGVLLGGGASANTIGGGSAAARNVISANGNSGPVAGSGVEISGSGSSGNVVAGNYIGANAAGTTALGNGRSGVLIGQGATNNIIGGAAAGSGNLIVGTSGVISVSNLASPAAVFSLAPATISGNIASFAVSVHYTDASSKQMVYLGVDLRQSSAALAPVNSMTAQQDFSAFNFVPSSVIGSGWAPIANAFPGEFLYHTPPPPGTQPPSGLAPNATYTVGTVTYDLSKFGIQPNSSNMVSIAGTDTVVGSQVPADPATFAFLTSSFSTGQQPLVQSNQAFTGVEVKDAGTSGNSVQGNLIGTDPTGALAEAQLGIGVDIHGGASQNMVGGTTSGSGNTIANNGQGVVIGSNSTDVGTVHNSVLGNSISSNKGLGIDLGNTSTTLVNAANPQSFPNDGQNAPLITAVSLHSISAILDSVPNTSFRIEYFATSFAEGANQGKTLLTSQNVTTNATGNASFSTPATVPLGAVITATATNLANGDTGAFSPPSTQLIIANDPIVTNANLPRTVTFNAQLAFGAAPVTSGQVTFAVPGLLGSVTATPNSSGAITANFVVPAGTAAGQYPITASFGGLEGIQGTTGVGTLTINSGNTATAVSSSLNPSKFGDQVIFTAAVSASSGAFDNGGSVQFAVDGGNFGAPASLTNGHATIGDAALSVGSHIITAVYSGDANFAGSNGALSGAQIVNPITPPPTPVVVSPANATNLPEGTVGVAYSSPAFTASGGVGAGFSFTETGRLPAGLTFDAKTNKLVGTPTEQGFFSGIVITATDGNGDMGSATYTLHIDPTPLQKFNKLGAYRPSNGSWSLDSDGTFGFDGGRDQVFYNFSPPGVTGVAGHWTGATRRDEVGDFQNGVWHLDLNNNGIVDPGETFAYGQAGDQPVVGDWNGDGKSNLGVFRSAPDNYTGEFILDSNENHTLDAADEIFIFGVATDRIVVGDWTGDGKSKVGVFRDAVSFIPSDAGDAVFSLDLNNNHTFDGGDSVFIFGVVSDGFVIGDWNGNGMSNVGVYRDGSQGFNAPGVALFSLDTNGNHQYDAGIDSVFLYGVTTDQFVGGNWIVTPPLQPQGTPTPAQYSAAGIGSGGVPSLTDAELQPVLAQALANWSMVGANVSQLQKVKVRIGDLDNSLVGWTSGDTITLDVSAAGWGWFVDSSPAQNEEFTSSDKDGLLATPGSPASERMDLLTVVEHELGHELGLSDQNPLTNPSDLMAATLPLGVRRLP